MSDLSNPDPAQSRMWKSNFILLSWGHMLWLTSPNLLFGTVGLHLDLTTLFQLSSWMFYSALYLLPAILLIHGCTLMLAKSRSSCMAIALVSTTTLLLLIKTDLSIYERYQFHINRFVLNLVFTPGGISSLGGTSGTYLSEAMLGVQVLLIQGALLTASVMLCNRRVGLIRHHGISAGLVGLFFLVQSLVYGISDVQNYGPVLEGSRAFPLFQRIRFRSLARQFGYDHKDTQGLNFSNGENQQTTLQYPLASVPFTPVDAPLNFVFLVAESLRWDQLTPEIMPNTWHFAQQNLQFEQHYSSGNGTREGLFGMFYGLYGSYWEPFMHARQSPLLMDRLHALGYQFDIRTSATFTYPEFDKTLFASIPEAELRVADDSHEPWMRDQLNTRELVTFLQQHNRSMPFMSFFFFESTHASYSFPEDQALYPEYAEDLDYTTLTRHSLAADSAGLLNRYHNAAHWIDVQLGQIYTTLENQGLLENTVVIVTGDHGEEFMEKGAWGHNSSFTEEQTHVPMVVHMPGQAAASITPVTTHLDISPTLLQLLGAPHDTSTYSLGLPLLETMDRPYIVLSDWHSISVQTSTLKYRIPYLNSGIDNWAPTSQDDGELSEAQSGERVQNNQLLLLDAIANTSKFTRGRSR